MVDNRRIGPVPALLAGLGALVLIAMLAHGLAGGYVVAQTAAIASITWGRALLVDIYVGLALLAGWIGWREAGRPAVAAAWIVALLVIGNLVACAYVLLAWYRSRGDAAAFWHGRRA